MFSVAWVVGCLALSWAYLSDLNASLAPGHSPAALMIGLGAAALLPIIFFFGVAHMAWRSQELRLITQSMAQVAMRLGEPENIARDSIVTVGQAIRREVAAMGDGVERALARAGELETLVQNEVAALERTYSDNEVRIRGLLQELANQRDTLVGQAEQVRSAINNVHIDLTQDLSTISDLVGQQVNDAAQRITHSLAEKGEHITMALGQVGDDMIQQLSLRGGDLLVRLESASEETSRAISTASDQLTSNLNFKTDHVGEDFAEIVSGLEEMMTSRLDTVAEKFSEKSLALVDTMIGRSQEVADLVSGRAQELSDAIVDTSSQIAETIASRADEVNSTLKATGESLILDLNLRGGDVAKKLEQTGNQITDTLVSRSTHVTETLRESVDHSRRSACVPRRRHEGHAGVPARRVRRHVQPFRRRARRKDIARLRHARQSHYPASRRVRPHGENLRIGASRAPRRAHPGRLRVDARLRRELRYPSHCESRRGHHRARSTPVALPGSDRRPHPNSDRRACGSDHGHRQDFLPKAARRSLPRLIDA